MTKRLDMSRKAFDEFLKKKKLEQTKLFWRTRDASRRYLIWWKKCSEFFPQKKFVCILFDENWLVHSSASETECEKDIIQLVTKFEFVQIYFSSTKAVTLHKAFMVTYLVIFLLIFILLTNFIKVFLLFKNWI